MADITTPTRASFSALAVLLFAGVLLAGAPAQADIQSENNLLFFLGRGPAPGTDLAAYYKRLETTNFGAYPSARVQRRGQNLNLQVLDAANITLANNTACPPEGRSEDNCVQYYFLADLPTRHAFLVARNVDSVVDFLLIDDRSGRRVTLRGIPRYSDVSQVFIVMNCGGPARGNALELYRRDDYDYTSIYALPAAELNQLMPGASCRLVSWNNSTLAIDFWMGDERASPHTHAELRGDTDGSWTLSAEWPAKK